jgi:hypothetical protein
LDQSKCGFTWIESTESKVMGCYWYVQMGRTQMVILISAWQDPKDWIPDFGQI